MYAIRSYYAFQFLVNSWGTIIELISIYKRLRAFEATIGAPPAAPVAAPSTEGAPL